MKYIKKHKIIENSNSNKIEVNAGDDKSIQKLKDRLNDLTKEISIFNQRKSNLENTIMNNTDDKDISSVIDKIVEDNKFLRMYLPIVNKMKSIKKTTDRIDYYKELLDERNNDLNIVNKLTDLDEKQEQVKKLKGQISDIKDKQKSMSDKIKELKKKIDEEKKKLKVYIDDMKSKFEEDIKSLKIDVNIR